MSYVTPPRDVRYSPRWLTSRHRASECVSIAADGTRTVFRPAAEARTRSATPRAPRVSRQDAIRSLLMSLPTIHEEEGL